jgi:hypothetical protein
MNTDNTQDGAEPSPASAGSRGEPVAWGVFYGDGKLHSSWDSHAKAECTAVTMRRFDHLGVYVSPLYRSPTLTDAEREAIAWFSIYSDTPGEERHAVVLEKLIARCRADFDR